MKTHCDEQSEAMMGKLHTPSLAAESAQPQGEYLGKSIKAANEHTPFKPAAPLQDICPTDLLSHMCPTVYVQGHPPRQD